MLINLTAAQLIVVASICCISTALTFAVTLSNWVDRKDAPPFLMALSLSIAVFVWPASFNVGNIDTIRVFAAVIAALNTIAVCIGFIQVAVLPRN